jgi:lactate racemase
LEFTVKHDLWGNDRDMTISLPEHWNASVLHMEGDSKRVLGNNDYSRALAPLAQMLKGKKEICVLFDDLSRPTRAYRVLPSLLELFDKAGIRDEQVRFICALGTHAALDNVAFRKKLGEEVMERFAVYNHNPYENCSHIGKTTLGTPVMVNKDYLSCDLRIGIGSFVPHGFCGYGGGYKIVFPAVSHIDAIEYHHGQLLTKYRDVCFGLGRCTNNPLLEDMKEYGRIARLDAKIDFLVNSEAEAVDIYAGHPDGLYNYMIPKAASHYRTQAPEKADVVFTNAYSKANEATIALAIGEALLKDEGGYIVLLCDIDGGQVVHYLLGRFGKDLWGRLAWGERKHSEKVKKIFIYARHRDVANESWFGSREIVSWHKDMGEIVQVLGNIYGDRKLDAMIIPDGTIQTL